MAATAGRRQELDTLRQVVASVEAGGPQVVEIHGEAGIGKTRLLDELARMVEDHSIRLVCVRGREYAQNEPMAVIAEVCAGVDAGLRLTDPHRQVREMLARAAPLAVLLDDLHRADEASHGVLEHLLLDLPQVPLLIAVAYPSTLR